jgi:hypothetical protein
LKYNIGKEWDRNDTQKRDKNHKRQGTGKTNGKREGKHTRGKYSALAERPKWCTDRTNAMIWELWPECSGRWPVDL